MKFILAILAFPLIASAADVSPKNEWTPSWQNPKYGFAIKKQELGSGEPSKGFTEGLDVAAPVADGFFHVPGSMPGFPTAATLWPRVQPVDCDQVGEKIICDGYNVNLAQGRGEYIYIQPNVRQQLIEREPHVEHPPIILPPMPTYTPPKIFKKKPRRRLVVKKPVEMCK